MNVINLLTLFYVYNTITSVKQNTTFQETYIMNISTIFDLVGFYRIASSHLFVMKHLSKAKSKGVETVSFYLDPNYEALMVKYDDKPVLSMGNWELL